MNKLAEKVNPSVSRDAILKTIGQHFKMVDQSVASGHWGSAQEYQHKAEALIELLEIDDCGNTGGLDRGRGQPEADWGKSRRRYEWLSLRSQRVTTRADERLAAVKKALAD